MSHVVRLDISNNLLRRLPSDFGAKFANLKFLNVQGNRFITIKEDVVSVFNDSLSNNLQELWINLAREEEVEIILKALKGLKVLNGLPVDRTELDIDCEEEDDQPPQRHVATLDGPRETTTN